MRFEKFTLFSVPMLLAGAAHAHDGHGPHLHPHGVGAVVLGLIVAAGVFGLWKAGYLGGKSEAKPVSVDKSDHEE